MPPEAANPARGEAAGLGKDHLLGGDELSKNSASADPDQGRSRNRERLPLLRDSTWRVADTAAIHLDLALGCLQVADDDGLTHHVARAVNAMRAVAKLINEISSIRNGGST
jgi:hypothetical protein